VILKFATSFHPTKLQKFKNVSGSRDTMLLTEAYRVRGAPFEILTVRQFIFQEFVLGM
jgi:hypothetical protein